MNTTPLIAFIILASSSLFAQTQYQLEPAMGTLPKTNIVLFKASIDATDDILIRNGKVQLRHVAGNSPAHISINGKTWEPNWNKDLSSYFSKFSPSLATLNDSKINVKLLKGRGSAEITEMPSAQNDYTLVVQVKDGKSGAGDVEVEISIIPN